MAKDNIYDKIVSELILRSLPAGGSGSSNLPVLVVSSSLPSDQVPVGFSGNVAFTSEVLNIPSGYSVDPNSHVITYPTATSPTTGSTALLTGPSLPVALVSLGNTFTVTSTITLVSVTGPNIVLTGSVTLVAVAPGYYGVVPYSPTPTLAGLSTFASTVPVFSMVSTGVGRLLIALPTGSPTVLTVSQSTGLIYPVSDFTVTISGGYDYYQLNYDTQLTGANIKTFTLNYI